MTRVNSKRLGEFCRAIGQVSHWNIPPARAYYAEAGFDLEGANQDCRREAFGLCDDVQQPVHSVGEIDICPAGRPVHDLSALGFPGFGVATQIGLADVGFGLGDDAGEPFPVQNPYQATTKQFTGDGEGGTGVEGGEEGHGGSG